MEFLAPLQEAHLLTGSGQAGRGLACQEKIQGEHPETPGLHAVPGHEEKFVGHVHQMLEV